MKYIFPFVPLAAGTFCLFHGIENHMANIILLGMLFLALALAAFFFLYLDESAPDEDELIPTGQRICILCSGGPDNPHSPSCRCGFEYWDLADPAE